MTWPLARTLNLDRPRGALVVDVARSSPAERAGLKPLDVILAVGGTAIARTEDLPRVVARHLPGSTVRLVLWRERREHGVDVVLDRLSTEATSEPEPAREPLTGRYGVESSDAPSGGALVRRVEPRSSAAGELEPGDIVVEANHAPVRSARDLERVLAGPPPILLKVRRADATRFVALESP